MLSHIPSTVRIAIVHDWLTSFGAEKVLEHLIDLYPHADLFAVMDFLDPEHRHFLRNKPVTTSFIQQLPFARTRYKSYLALMPLAVEGFDLSSYDIVISSSHAVAKGVITGPDQLHICYCHTPIRYAWELQHQYLQQAGLVRGAGRIAARLVLHYMRLWDLRTSNGVDVFVANSEYVSRRISKTYRRAAHVIYPPVDVNAFPVNNEDRDDYFIVVSRIVPYKRIALIVEAFAKMPARRLVVVGSGPGLRACQDAATSNVVFMGYQSAERLQHLISHARAFVFAAEEDFGISVVEAQACGTPVICYARGGATETVIANETGIMFQEQSADSICEAIDRFESQERSFRPARLRENAQRFSVETFRSEFTDLVASTWRAREHAKELRVTQAVPA